MGKSLRRRTSIPNDNNQIGCIWGLIRIFDFRHSPSNQKRLLDSRFGSKHSVDAGHSRSKTDPLSNSDEQSDGIDDNEESAMVINVANKSPSVKRLMEEDMHAEQDLKKHDSNAEEVETGIPNLESGDSIKRKKMKTKMAKKAKKKKKKISDGHVSDSDVAGNSGSESSFQQNLEQEIANYASINAIVDELCSQVQENKSSGGESKLGLSVSEEKLHEAIKVFLHAKFINGKHNSVEERLPQSKEFRDALQILSSNREVLLKLLQDPNSVLPKHFQSFLDFHVEKNEKSMTTEGPAMSEQEPSNSKPSEELVGHKHHNFFGWMKFRGGKPSMSVQDSNRIVILKPRPEGLQNPKTETDRLPSPESFYIAENNGMIERADSHFSLSKMSRKFKKAMVRDLHGVSVGDSSSRFSFDGDKKIGGEMHSPNRDHFFNERIPKSSIGIRKGDKNRNSKEFPELVTLDYPKRRVSSLHVDAVNRLCDENEGLSSRRDPESIRRTLSLPEYYSSPVSSPRRNWEPSPVSAHTRLSASNRLQMVNDNVWRFKLKKNSSVRPAEQNLGTNLSIHGDNAGEAQSSHPNVSDEAIHDSEKEVTLCSIQDETSSREATNSSFQKESNVFDIPSEPSNPCLNRNEQHASNGGVSECLKLDSDVEKQSSSSPFSSPSSSSIAIKDEHLEISIDRRERPSPVSVLEPLFAEDDFSSASTVGDAAELPIQPLQIHFEESGFSTEDHGTCAKTCTGDKEIVFEFVKAVLLASRVSWDDFFTSSLSSDQLLDASLLQEVELFPSELCHDLKLLFDCINEVLVEVFEHYCACSPWISFIKPSIRPIPNSKNVVNEVWEGVSWLLLPLHSACTLDQIISKDMAKSRTWMDLRPEAETIGTEMGESIMKELIEETVGGCLNGRQS